MSANWKNREEHLEQFFFHNDFSTSSELIEELHALMQRIRFVFRHKLALKFFVLLDSVRIVVNKQEFDQDEQFESLLNHSIEAVLLQVIRNLAERCSFRIQA